MRSTGHLLSLQRIAAPVPLLWRRAFLSEAAPAKACSTRKVGSSPAARSVTRQTRASLDAARPMSRLIRNIDFATRDEDGAILVAFTQTGLRNT